MAENNFQMDEAKIDSTNIPLVVDLDGTLINTDLLHEAIILLVKKNPLYIFMLPLWLAKGKAYFKNRLFRLVQLDYQSLPYNQELLRFLKAESAKGRKIILATASPQFCAEEVAKVHPIFSNVYGTGDGINLKAGRKLQLLIKQFGKAAFDYIGNTKADLVIFQSSRFSYLVNPSKAVEKKARQVSELKKTWNSAGTSIKDFIKAIRVYQWIKNILLFVPLITSHTANDLSLIKICFYAFCAFSLTASAGYLINDILDINSDRKHLRKKNRPVASGKLSVIKAFSVAILFLIAGFTIAANINLLFLSCLFLYFCISLMYSLFIKKRVLYDVFTLTVLYSIRVFAGAVVIDVVLSFWLIAFSTFIFLSLAFVKRYAELAQMQHEVGLQKQGRGYIAEDLNLLQVMGVSSGFLAVVVFSLYINSPEVTKLYSNPKILWAISFLFLFWVSRIWLFTTRGKMTDDPIVFAIKDITSYWVFLFAAILIWVAM